MDIDNERYQVQIKMVQLDVRSTLTQRTLQLHTGSHDGKGNKALSTPVYMIS